MDAVAEEELNDRPRKTLGWEKPSERIMELLSLCCNDHQNPPMGGGRSFVPELLQGYTNAAMSEL